MLIYIRRWIEAEQACDAALGQHKSVKAHWRRAQARKAQGRIDDAIKGNFAVYYESTNEASSSISDIRAVLRLHPSNKEAQAELAALVPPDTGPASAGSTRVSQKPASPSPSSSKAASSSNPAASSSSSTAPPPSSTSSKTIPHRPGRLKQKASPFPRTEADDRKLKISCLPLTVDIPAMCDLLAYANSRPKSGKENKGKKTQSSTFTAPNGVQTTTETFSYPSWDRYVVKRVSS